MIGTGSRGARRGANENLVAPTKRPGEARTRRRSLTPERCVARRGLPQEAWRADQTQLWQQPSPRGRRALDARLAVPQTCSSATDSGWPPIPDGKLESRRGVPSAVGSPTPDAVRTLHDLSGRPPSNRWGLAGPLRAHGCGPWGLDGQPRLAPNLKYFEQPDGPRKGACPACDGALFAVAGPDEMCSVDDVKSVRRSARALPRPPQASRSDASSGPARPVRERPPVNRYRRKRARGGRSRVFTQLPVGERNDLDSARTNP